MFGLMHTLLCCVIVCVVIFVVVVGVRVFGCVVCASY